MTRPCADPMFAPDRGGDTVEPMYACSLVEVLGFDNMTITPDVGGSYNLRIVDNPNLSGCRADELYQLFVSTGFPDTTLTVENNGPCP